jgi:hypothetical protein
MAKETNHIEQAIAAQIEALNTNFPQLLEIEVEYGGHTYQGGQKSYIEMVSALLMESLPEDFFWIDKYNNRVPFSRADLQALTQIVFNARFEIFQAHQNRKQLVKNATSLEDLFAPEIMGGLGHQI